MALSRATIPSARLSSMNTAGLCESEQRWLGTGRQASWCHRLSISSASGRTGTHAEGLAKASASGAPTRRLVTVRSVRHMQLESLVWIHMAFAEKPLTNLLRSTVYLAAHALQVTASRGVLIRRETQRLCGTWSRSMWAPTASRSYGHLAHTSLCGQTSLYVRRRRFPYGCRYPFPGASVCQQAPA